MDAANEIAMMEHLAVALPISLHEFCDRFRQILNLPEFDYDSENETEWGVVETPNMEYNVSRPYDCGTLQDWDSTVPDGCNFGVSLILYRSHPNSHDHDWALSHIVVPVAQQLAYEFNIPVHYHRTWFGVGNNVPRNTTFFPKVE